MEPSLLWPQAQFCLKRDSSVPQDHVRSGLAAQGSLEHLSVRCGVLPLPEHSGRFSGWILFVLSKYILVNYCAFIQLV